MQDILKQKTLLYAEDEPDIQKQYAQYFKNYFKDVFLATDGKEALNIYEDKKPDVVVLDINMPKKNGLEVAQKIREHDDKTQILLLSARSDKKCLKTAIELGLVCYLEKPITRSDLTTALSKIRKKLEPLKCIKLWQIDEEYYTWNDASKELKYKDEVITLSKQESLLFTLFVSNLNANIDYQAIYEAVWYDIPSKDYKESTIKTLISTLRAKLPSKGVVNSYGVGYKLNVYKVTV